MNKTPRSSIKRSDRSSVAIPRPRLLSGIQPSGKLHLGNYLGALKNFVDLQNSGKYECFFFVADLHSLTEKFDPKKKREQILELVADYLAAGLEPSTSLRPGPKKSVIYAHSQIPAHSELAFILNTITPMGELERMTQYKDKTSSPTTYNLQPTTSTNVGLFTYPTLMAADIILYDAKFVPTGDDQDQHLELTRTLVRKFNSKFGKTFIEPQGLHTDTPRVMSLGDPIKKMSKSKPETCLFLDDSPAVIESKIKRAVTDSDSAIKFDPSKKPAISNLLKIYSSLDHRSIDQLERAFANKSYSEFKSSLADLVVSHFTSYRQKKKALLAKPQTLVATLNKGATKASKIADKKISEVKKKIGLLV
ncbi:MAG: tryptophan--tRNA ligase [Candidatus Liptonbacteria bacterium]|nr:tryptophan--tRNA ligase [Candidatus Liptonbacteria bacterium]